MEKKNVAKNNNNSTTVNCMERYKRYIGRRPIRVNLRYPEVDVLKEHFQFRVDRHRIIDAYIDYTQKDTPIVITGTEHGRLTGKYYAIQPYATGYVLKEYDCKEYVIVDRVMRTYELYGWSRIREFSDGTCDRKNWISRVIL